MKKKTARKASASLISIGQLLAGLTVGMTLPDVDGNVEMITLYLCLVSIAWGVYLDKHHH